MSATKSRRHVRDKSGHVRDMPIRDLTPSPENDLIYGKVAEDDPETVRLALSIRQHGVMEPLHVTRDGYIVSGHRRWTAARTAGLRRVPCVMVNATRGSSLEPSAAHMVLLREYNRQRDKTAQQKLREELVTTEPDRAYEALVGYRESAAALDIKPIVWGASKSRNGISGAKQAMLQAAIAVINAHAEFWPLSVRQIHYGLLNDPPLRHSQKPESRYANDIRSYKDLSDLLTRARVAGVIPDGVIDDATRTVTVWDVHAGFRSFIRRELDWFLLGYRRDLMQSQPHHVEIWAEKLTLANIVGPIAKKFCIPLTIARGYSSLPPRQKLVERYSSSGKDKLIVICLSDFDPDGEMISQSLPSSLVGDFGIPRKKVVAVKSAITAEHIDRYNLPPNYMGAKAGSSNYSRFVSQTGGDDVYELEALEPAQLQELLTETIDQTIDVETFNAELAEEKADAAKIDTVRRFVMSAMQEVNLDEFECEQ